MPEDLEYTKRLLEIEYAQVRARLGTLDDIRFKLKGWAITVSTGLLALGFTRRQPWIMALSLPLALIGVLRGYSGLQAGEETDHLRSRVGNAGSPARRIRHRPPVVSRRTDVLNSSRLSSESQTFRAYRRAGGK